MLNLYSSPSNSGAPRAATSYYPTRWYWQSDLNKNISLNWLWLATFRGRKDTKGDLQRKHTKRRNRTNNWLTVRPRMDGWIHTTDLILPLVITVRRKYPYTLLGSVDMYVLLQTIGKMPLYGTRLPFCHTFMLVPLTLPESADVSRFALGLGVVTFVKMFSPLFSELFTIYLQ